MFVCPAGAFNESQDPEIKPLSPGVIQKIASFLLIDLRRANALHLIAQHLHQRKALFCERRMPITDYRMILNAVFQHDPYALLA